MHGEIEQDILKWIDTFVAAPNAFYGGKFAPCPYARGAMIAGSVDVAVWDGGDTCGFIRQNAIEVSKSPVIGTRVVAFPPRLQWTLGLSEYVEALNMEMIAKNVFLNTGVARTTISCYAGSGGEPYFIVVVNSLDAVLRAARSLQKTDFYKNWPKPHYELVVERRATMAERYRKRWGPHA